MSNLQKAAVFWLVVAGLLFALAQPTLRWSRITERPANVTALEGVTGVGLLERTGPGAIGTRTVGVAAGSNIPSRADADARYRLLSSLIPQADVNGLVAALAAKADSSSLAPVATSGSATDLGAGTLPAARMPAMSGAVTSAAGSTSTTLGAGVVGSANLIAGAVGATELGANAVTAVKIADGAVTSTKLASSIGLSGVPTAPTAAVGTNTTQLATTAGTRAEIANRAVLYDSAQTLTASQKAQARSNIDFLNQALALAPELLRNGDGEFGVDNWTLSSGPPLSADGSDVPPDPTIKRALKVAGTSAYTFLQSDIVAVPPTFGISLWYKNGNSDATQVDTAGTWYLGFAEYALDNVVANVPSWKYIDFIHTNRFAGSSPLTLAADLVPGATSMTLSSSPLAAGWYNDAGTPSWRNMAIEYTDGFGKKHNVMEYSQKTSGIECQYFYSGDSSLWNAGALSASPTVALRTPWPSVCGTIPAGTAVANAIAGGSFKYLLSVVAPANNWVRYPTALETYHIVSGNGNGINQTRNNTKGIRVIFLVIGPSGPTYTGRWNYSVRGGGKL